MNDHVCGVDALLRHRCRTMLGARAAGYDDTPANFDAQHLAHQRRTGTRLDFAHAFATDRQLPFDDRYVGTWARGRADSWIVHNWKPVARWSDIDSPEARRRVRLAARRIKHLGHPVMLVLHHEPENELTRKGRRGKTTGTPQEYRHMWAVVRKIFDDAEVTNVVWGMAYMNYPKWDDVVPLLWPGDGLVDWLWHNAYGSADRPDPAANIAHFTDLVEQHRLGIGKPRGIIEWGIAGVARPTALNYFEQATAFLDSDAADAIDAWMIFDSPGAHNERGLRLGFDDKGSPFNDKLRAYQQFAQHSRFRCEHC
jgi:hypothetical protein